MPNNSSEKLMLSFPASPLLMALPNMVLVTACSSMLVIVAILPNVAQLLVRFGFHADFWNLRLMKICPISMQALAKTPILFSFAVQVDRPRSLARR